MALSSESRARFNLKDAVVLVVEGGALNMEILVSMLVGFGARNMHKHHKIEEAKLTLGKIVADLILIGDNLADGEGCDLVRWIRHEMKEPNRFAPVVMVTGHTGESRIAKARDCGAHFIIARPLTPIVLLERIVWIARERRPFVEIDGYIGPDRRFKNEGLPAAAGAGRRNTDLTGEISDIVAEPNMSQDEIDGLMSVRKVAL